MEDRFKFRVWDEQGEKFIDWDFAITIHGDLLIGDDSKTEDDDKGWMVTKRDYTIQQCTGLKDKNNKLIYEGDILKKHGVVRWGKFTQDDDVFLGWYMGPGLCEYAFHDEYLDDLEVIGNIFDNPDLI